MDVQAEAEIAQREEQEMELFRQVKAEELMEAEIDQLMIGPQLPPQPQPQPQPLPQMSPEEERQSVLEEARRVGLDLEILQSDTLSGMYADLDQRAHDLQNDINNMLQRLSIDTPPRFPCVFCKKEGHWPDECNNFPTVAQRRTYIERNNLCSTCTRNHQGVCRRAHIPCRICKRLNHTASTCYMRIYVVQNLNQLKFERMSIIALLRIIDLKHP